ncbi:hypothetical protein [Archangium sp.]|uniref:hypothetical protein n=1 Tax=Archangium sp. TaxID=1872627 RepID=UPI002D4ED4CB|nr:hypothetical protein [Archangium sp.]HYO55443.1 hypothetical protein [Archangium sp.]
MPIDVFISAGRAATSQQEEFISNVEGLLRAEGFRPRSVGRTDFSADQPLKFIEKVMGECAGVVIIAFERIHIEQGTELRGGPKARSANGHRVPTVWNHIEAAMAYVTRRPLLVIVEDGLRPEGLLETGYDWYVQRVELSKATLDTSEFRGILGDWKRKVGEVAGTLSNARPRGQGSELDPVKLTIGQILSAVTPAQAWAIAAALITLLGGVASGAYWLGAKFSNSPRAPTQTQNAK